MSALHEHIFLLFYSVASAEGTVRKEEVYGVNLDLIKPWIEVEDHDQILEAWLTLQKQGVSSVMAFNKFRDYFNLNRRRFTKHLRHQLSEVCGAIAVAFAGNNKSELTLLAQLYFLFND